MSTYKPHTACRCCGSTNLTQYLNLGMMPLANNLQPTREEALNVERYPLQVMLCEDCSLSQLSIVVDPEVMFSSYNYRSSVNGGYVKHCRQMAQEFKERFNLHTSDKDFGSFVIDIAGNDGALLHEFDKVIPGLKSLNIDPARNLAPINEAKGVRQFTKFWSMQTAKEVEALGWPKADLIIATNVFAHVDNVREFLEACKYAIKNTGSLILEFPYLLDYIENGEWPTTYHEHLSYFSIRPLLYLCLECGLHINAISKHDIHCGTLRVEISREYKQSPGMSPYLNEPFIYYSGYQDQLQKCVADFSIKLANLKGSVGAFAASAKGITFLNSIPTCSKIEYVVDETPEKIGKYIPGVGIEVVPMVHLLAYPVDYLIILSWNFLEEIKSKCRAAGYKGKFITPIPTWKIAD